ncbi:MAG: tRNA (adenosine(37)-N6)-threonylcarbamoyltransferase complex ATPase subunit type 1 TsaE [Verrucomicrobiota bacterium]|nr:tRNA (adenosine(37)-N6)-threonylcarbamoyltransferase complex ATPase subunit type 1 TsaE [Verrucomicrobiota bacterium]MEC9328152.1 tRNA (adenosine(37)-N6)-threonylcarbamoyltransferase complex ATPase subunit type 1 TsaE [Verrucomicrobiota bacterium]MED6298854.1 tRNA (adenosine(37)-N6)-threonylcarbamoyltransferase complex ATPase subunit type 1 TsaE [Verrucomicrobiota bacterium]
MKNLIIDNEEAMVGAGKMLGSTTRPGDVFALVGDLGAGKTHFTKGLVHGAGCESSVTSPTFPLLHEYLQGKFPIYHFDFYRINSVHELIDIGWDDYTETDGICVIEWADKFPEIIPKSATWFQFSIENNGSRIIQTINSP